MSCSAHSNLLENSMEKEKEKEAPKESYLIGLSKGYEKIKTTELIWNTKKP